MGGQACCAGENNTEGAAELAAASPTPTTAKAETKKLLITFAMEGEPDVDITFEKTPIGFTFKNKTPMVVTKTTHAEKLGVKSGMVIKAINNVAVPADYGSAFNMFKSSLADLPKMD